MTDKPAPSRVEKRKIEFRDKIADAAYELIVRDGVANTSVASIVKHADIAHQTFFNHFPTKNHLLLYIADRIAELANAIFTETGEQQITPPKKIEYCFSTISLEMTQLDPNIKELVTHLLIGTPEGTNAIKSSQGERLNQIIHDILQEAKKQNTLAPGFSLVTLVEIVRGIFVSTIINWASQEDYPLIEKMNKAIKFINYSVFVNNKPR